MLHLYQVWNAPQVKQEALQAKQNMFNRQSTTEKALREHKDLLATAREELAGQRSLVETLRANAKNLRQQIGASKVRFFLAAETIPAAITELCLPDDGGA